MTAGAREAWERLYSGRELQYGGSGDIGPLASYLRPGMLVLDAGCGDGKTALAMTGKCEVVGCDFSREALLSLRAQRDPYEQVNLVECDVYSLPFEPEKFDAIACVHTLSHMLGDGRVRAAEELSRVLRPNGALMVEVFGKGDIRYGRGQEVEPSSFMRGNGILTHYFEEGEIPGLFPEMLVISETSSVRRVSYGPIAGRRISIKVLLRKA
ncbi:MAG: class I SAM-dependent methyltransferase [Thermoplasmata archaeon]